jgi:hypothetical protein
MSQISSGPDFTVLFSSLDNNSYQGKERHFQSMRRDEIAIVINVSLLL